MKKNNPYTTPDANLEIASMESLPNVLYVLASFSIVFSLWYLGLDGRKWFIPLEGMDTYEISREWITRAFYGLPKIGVIVGFVSLFKFNKFSFRIYFVCWVFAIGHTIMYYGAYNIGNITSTEMLRIAIHHVIPHTFYITMLIILISCHKAANKSFKPSP